MARASIVPNELQGGQGEPVWIEGEPPVTLTRLGAAKVEFLVRGVAQLRSSATVLELFGGTNLSTAVIAAALSRPQRLVSVDLFYAPATHDKRRWHYYVRENYRLQAQRQRVKREGTPSFVCADAASLPLADGAFDAVLAPDSPRTRFDASGVETSLNDRQQRELFARAYAESLRVLKPGGVFAATAVRSWLDGLPGLKIIPAPSTRLGFRAGDDPVVYVRAVKA